MQFVLVCSAAFLASGLTLFSGFGLGTLLMPVFALFFPLKTAVGLTAVVHFLNNLFKLVFFGRRADKGVVIGFGLPAIFAAFFGAFCLSWLSDMEPLFRYQAFGREMAVLPVKLSLGALMIAFALLELSPSFENLSFDRKYLPLGGILSGFFGGLSGQQGALRSAFLIRCGLSKESFIASGVVIACLVDVARLGVYAARFSAADASANASLLIAAASCAFIGVWAGTRLVHKVTLRAVRRLVAVLLLAIALGLSAGII